MVYILANSWLIVLDYSLTFFKVFSFIVIDIVMALFVLTAFEEPVLLYCKIQEFIFYISQISKAKKYKYINHPLHVFIRLYCVFLPLIYSQKYRRILSATVVLLNLMDSEITLKD